MGLICLNCKNRGEIPEELKPLAESFRAYYKEVIYCKALETLAVANPNLPTQTREKCEKFSAQAQTEAS
jgi:hypothetical protein